MELFQNVTQVVAFIGIMAFLVSVITEALKLVPWLNQKLPTSLLVILLSLVLCPAALLALVSYYHIVITWYMILASVIVAFVVALVAMDGWERVEELAKRLIKK